MNAAIDETREAVKRNGVTDQAGTVTCWKRQMGFGVVTSDDLHIEYWFHESRLSFIEQITIKEGSRVVFSADRWDERKGRRPNIAAMKISK